MTESAPGHPEIERIVAPNPGPMTLEGTNTYVVADGISAWVIDPGPDDPAHVSAVREAARRRGKLAGVLLTHSHADHSQAAPRLDAPLLWGSVARGDEEWLESGAGAALDEGWPPEAPSEPVGPFRVVPTPGHSIDHVCFVLGRVCFCGDLILGSGSSFVPPDGGSLAAYLDSLARLKRLGLELLCPGHGPPAPDPEARIDNYIRHRLDREQKLLAAFAEGVHSRARLLELAWDDVPDELRDAAVVVMQAHLEKLEAEGRLRADMLTD